MSYGEYQGHFPGWKHMDWDWARMSISKPWHLPHHLYMYINRSNQYSNKGCGIDEDKLIAPVISQHSGVEWGLGIQNIESGIGVGIQNVAHHKRINENVDKSYHILVPGMMPKFESWILRQQRFKHTNILRNINVIHFIHYDYVAARCIWVYCIDKISGVSTVNHI